MAPTSGVFAGAHDEVGTRIEGSCDLGEGGATYEGSARAGEVAFGEGAVAPIELVGDDPAEERVAEEFEALVVQEAFAGVLVEV